MPYVRPPEEIVPGKPLFFATAMTLGGAGVGLLVESHLGRPTKIEGNPDHPASLGATDLFHQASVLTLYDPDRSQTVTHLGQTATWDDALAALAAALDKQRPSAGAGLRLLTETVVSPTLGDQISKAFSRSFPRRNGINTSRWPATPPTGRPRRPSASRSHLLPILRLHRTRRPTWSLSLDADFLGCGARQPALHRRLHGAAGACGRTPTTPARRT